MKQFLLIIVVILLIFSCGKKETFRARNFSKVDVKHLLEDSLLNVRALEINEGRVVAVTSDGRIYRSILSYMNGFEEGNYWSQTEDSLVPSNFRSIAFQGDKTFTLSISSPAKLFYDGWLVYYENHPNAFYDSMDFWNDEEGIAIGDSTDGCLSVIITRDGGNTWTKLTCDELPKGTENEGAFAASDTNIAIVGDNTWVATTAGRVYYSPDKGKTWEVFDTPIIKEKDTEGIYSIDFYDALNGFAIGGDYTKPDDNAANKIKTTDGGKTWQLVAQNRNPGYRSCVQYIPKGNGKELVAIGFKGIDYSNDAGETWKHLSDEGFYTIRFLNDSVAYAAGAGRISKLTFRE
ncbi:oxidoreductase [Sabulilitoribacter multivorans]|uniref:Oxidoreductase n=1 Tax=Flaviramulus multivorans TaxID=1304750 RepID=A0ABS9IL74_9FLAO|nr:oxidoreductase [Flaviramulus multivorans]MCF7561358.1 oxidoreductase [Flaviramulus multivorans]